MEDLSQDLEGRSNGAFPEVVILYAPHALPLSLVRAAAAASQTGALISLADPALLSVDAFLTDRDLVPLVLLHV